MITEDIIWEEVWPVVERLIQATLAEDNNQIAALVMPGEQAADMLDLFGFAVFDILLKTVLGRERLGLSRAIEADNGRFVFIEYAWPDPASPDNSYTAADVVSVKLTRHQNQWHIVEINPATADLPLTGPRARGILTTSKILSEKDKVPAEPWILPIALYAGLLQLPLQPTAMQDPVEELLLPGLQHRTYGVMSLIRARRLWRDFRKVATPSLEKPAAWAAAVEFIMNEQNMRDLTQAAVGKQYKVGLASLVPRIKQIKKALNIQGLDERYTDIQSTQIVYKDDHQHNNGES
ncbi:MAG: hypothetical protein D6706_10405 [Chloroflexi bacterium]|nr:MAG: hypothetical protein D6706_10405 [Chloroflexota bacterium]